MLGAFLTSKANPTSADKLNYDVDKRSFSNMGQFDFHFSSQHLCVVKSNTR